MRRIYFFAPIKNLPLTVFISQFSPGLFLAFLFDAQLLNQVAKAIINKIHNKNNALNMKLNYKSVFKSLF